MSVIHQPTRPQLDARALLFPTVLFILLSGLLLRLWYYQVVIAPELADRAQFSNSTSASELAPRGLIYDRNGALLAGIKPEWVITAVPKEIDKQPDTLKKLAALIPADEAKLKAKLEMGRWKPWLPTPICVGASTEVASNIAERGDDFPGVDVRSQAMRYYPDPNSFSHLMGYVWVPSQGDVDRISAMGKEPADYVGKNGLEATYESNLMGEAGMDRVELDSKRRPTKVIGRDAPVPGDQLVLSVDKGLQQEAINALSGHRGAAIALDPKTGEVLCMASAPTFSLDSFRHGISQADFQSLRNDPGNPFLNRPIQVAFAPGSTFKLVTTIAAMQSGVFDPNRPEFCAGGYKLGNKFIKCLGHHGSITFHRALQKSCNAYFMSLAHRVKREGMIKAALDIGFYSRTGIDLPSERRAVVPTDRFMAKYWPKYSWTPADTVYLGIGQGILAVTPIQMANLIALVANDGINYRPHLVKALRNPTDPSKVQAIPPEETHHIDAPASFWGTVKSALVDVIEGGTAGSARIPGLTWGGKTGSAEEKKGAKTHSWFIGFAPYDNPKIAICVFIEQGGHGGEVAAPIAKRIVQRYLFPPKIAKAPSKSDKVPATAVDLSVAPVSR
jgi:penicillin-binding protein 2